MVLKRNMEAVQESLVEPRNRILRFILVWSLFCLIRLYVAFRLPMLSLNQDIKICVIMVYNFDV